MVKSVFNSAGEKLAWQVAQFRKIEELSLNADDSILSFKLDGGVVFEVYQSLQECCEVRWMHTDDELDDFLGARLLDFDIRTGGVSECTPEEMNSKPSWYDPYAHTEAYYTESEFLIVKTTAGEFTVVSYNSHNGYYSGFYISCRITDGEKEIPLIFPGDKIVMIKDFKDAFGNMLVERGREFTVLEMTGPFFMHDETAVVKDGEEEHHIPGYYFELKEGITWRS